MSEENNPILPGTATPEDPEYYNSSFGDAVPRPWWKAMGENTLRAMLDTPLSSWGRGQLQDTVEEASKDDPKLSPEDANTRFPVDKPWDAPVTEKVAKYVHEGEKDRKRIEAEVRRGELGAVASFASGAVPHVLDPINISLSLATGGLFGALGGTAKSFAARTGMLFAENVVGNAAGETFTYRQAQRERQDYGLEQSAGNVLVGAAGGVAFHYGLQALGEGYGRLKTRYNEKTAAAAVDVAVNQLESGKRVNVTPIIQNHLDQVSGKVKPGTGAPYTFRPLNAPDRPLYVAAEMGGDNLTGAQKATLDDSHGLKVVQLSDNPNVTNNAAARPSSEALGKFYEVEIPSEARLLNLDRPADGAAREVLAPYVKEEFGDAADDILKGESVGAILDNIRGAVEAGTKEEKILSEIQAGLEAGYDGTVHQAGGDTPHNVVGMFDSGDTGDAAGKIKAKQAITPDKNMVPEPTKEDLIKIQQDEASKKAGLFYDEEAQKLIDESIANPPKEVDIPELQADETALQEEIKSLVDQGFVSEEGAKELGVIAEAVAKAETSDKIRKAAMFCVGRNL